MPSFPEDYWASYEHEVADLGEFLDSVRVISAYQAATDSRFVWRGAANASWGLHSSLVRAFEKKHGSTPATESALREFEDQVIDEARSWGLDWHAAGGRLTALELLAAMQHYGVPTRMVDFTFNPLVALWFSVESEPSEPGRIFAIEMSQQLVSREHAAQPEPWWQAIQPRADTEWTTQPWIWRPPPLEPRIVRQEGCFLMGGVPSTQPARNVRTAPNGWRPVRAHEVRTCMSVPFRLINYEQARAASEGRTLVGKTPKARAFTLKVVGDKVALLADLNRTFGHSYRQMFPDFPGLSDYGESFR